jgi:ABC-type glutathione transport system ATPase component
VLLQIHDLKIEFPAGPRPLTAVRDIDFEVERGQVLGLVGESGSGKSVTSLAIMRLLPPQASATGEIHFQRGWATEFAHARIRIYAPASRIENFDDLSGADDRAESCDARW